MIHHVTRATRHLIFWSLVMAAITLSGVRLVLKGVESYKINLETRISVLVGTPVKLGSLGASMRGISPELVLKDINIASILTTEKPAIHLKEIRLGINLGEFLINQDVLSSSWITLVGARLSVYRKQDGQFAVEGLRAGNDRPLWLLQGRKYEVLQSQITWQDKQKGGMPLVLEAVNLAIMNDGEHHRINMLTKLPERYGDGLKMVLDFEAAADEPSEIKGTLFFEGNNVKLPELVSTYLPFGISMTTGSADVKLWSQWQQAKLVSVKADTQLRQAVFSRKGKGSFSVNSLDTQFNWQLKDSQWFVAVSRFLLESSEASKNPSKKWPDAVVSMAGEQATDTGFQKFKMYAKQLDLAEASKLLQFFAPLTDEQSQVLGLSQVSGILRGFSLYAEPNTKSFAVAGWFDSISIKPLLSMPGMENISGQVKGSDKLGVVGLDSQDVRFKDPRLFNKPLLFNQVKGILAWRQTEDQWDLASQSVGLDCAAFQSESRLFVRIPKTEEKPFIDLQTAFKGDDLGQIAAYLPTQIMDEELKVWLSNAFVGGKVTKGDLLFYGRPNDFPFTDGTGVFEAKLDLDKVELNYHPEWQHISGINGELVFKQNNILGSFNHGLIGKVDISKAEMLISGLGVDEQLTIKGEGQGEISQALNVLQQSPLASRVTPLITHTTIQGRTKATLDLTIPLRAGHEIKVDGNAQLKNAQLTVNRLNMKVNKINGDLKFNKQGIYGDAIQAYALGHPIQVNIAQADHQTLINVDGKATVSVIEKLFDWSGSQLAEGEGAYQLQLQIKPGANIDNNPLQLSIKSTLEGVALHLPSPLTKTKDQKKPSSLTFSLSDELALPIELDYNNELKVAASLNTKERKINSGHVLIGIGEVALSQAPGIKLEINREIVPLQDWLGLAFAQGLTSGSGFDISEIKIHSKSALWKKTRLGLFDLALKRSPSHWSGEIDSTVAKGKFQLPVEAQGADPVILDMEMLNMSALKQLKFQDTSSNFEFKPLLNIHSKKTLWQSENLGQLVLETERAPQGMIIKRLDLDGADEKLALAGDWKDNGVTSTTHLYGKLDMKKADQFLDKLNITKDLTGTSGVIDFKLNWNAAPWQMSLPDLRGNLDVNLNSGRILSIEPGFGRLLGILAVAQWFKRLQFDFSDIYEEGLTFNSIKGHFDLLNGKATTDNLVIDAVPAKITITGDTDLVKQTVDHVIKVVPKSLDALPIAGTIVGRVAAMVGKTLTGKDQEGFFFGTQYLVKGSWDDAKISSLHENDGIFQKTWNSIADFPWAGAEKQ
ncbi:YhdP family protein [Methyloglobulus sp.]|uniref:YhdP family protein n=1 Tax=Methyloglobulus sp. TaxID=2518622 RepID=UPI0039896AC4